MKGGSGALSGALEEARVEREGNGQDAVFISQSLNISSAGISISYLITKFLFVVINHFRFSPADAYISLTNVSISSNLSFNEEVT